MTLQAEKELKEAIKITKWYISGMEQIGGSLDLSYKVGWKRITELYNVEL